MAKINIESSTACNARCTFCPRYEMTRPMGEMSDELFHKIIKDGKEMGIYRYSPFMNGEPFVFSRIWEWLDYMQKEKVWVALYTNAEFIDVDRILQYKNIDYINCSINATTKKTHEKVMRGPDFDKCVKNAQELIRRSPFMARASFVRCEENTHEEEDFKKMFKKVKVEKFDDWTGARHSQFERKGQRIPCYVLFNQMFVLWDGRVVPCCMDYDAKMVLGDANKETLKEIWEKNGWMREKHRNLDFDIPICKNCKYNYDG